MILILTLGCIETGIGERPLPPVATPPPPPDDDRGGPPDWTDCEPGFLGAYTNHTPAHPDFEPDEDRTPADPLALDWWDDPSFQAFSANLDFGANWWPVDEGLEGDPAHFAVRWIAWIRARSDTTVRFVLGNADDAFLWIGEDLAVADAGIQPFEPTLYTFDVEAGQYPLEIRFAHRSGESGFRFRVLEGDVSLCYPDFGAPE